MTKQEQIKSEMARLIENRPTLFEIKKEIEKQKKMNKIILEELERSKENTITVYLKTEEQRNDLINELESKIKELKNMEFKKELPKTFEELEEVSGFYIKSCSTIADTFNQSTGKTSWNVFKTEKQAEKSRAMSKLSQAMAVYNDGWIADWNNRSQMKYVLDRVGNDVNIGTAQELYSFLSFKDGETATEFLKNFKEEIECFFEM